MAYTVNRQEITIFPAGVLQTPADKGNWAPGLAPYIIRGAAVLITTATTGAAGVVKGDIIQADGSTRGDGDAFTINVPNLAAGKVVYQSRNVKISPGQRVVCELTTATGAGAGQVVLDIERSPDTPSANSAMQVTT